VGVKRVSRGHGWHRKPAQSPVVTRKTTDLAAPGRPRWCTDRATSHTPHRSRRDRTGLVVFEGMPRLAMRTNPDVRER
jgi:hypothetical protein